MLCLRAKILLSIANSSCKCSSQNLGWKVTTHTQVSCFPSNQRSLKCTVQMLQSVVCKKIKLCYLSFSISVVIGQFSSKWPRLGSRTVMLGDRMQKKTSRERGNCCRLVNKRLGCGVLQIYLKTTVVISPFLEFTTCRNTLLIL